MNTKSVLPLLLFLAAMTLGAKAQNITNFGPNVGNGPVAVGTWTYDGTTSTANGTNSNGNNIVGTFPNVTDFSAANQITLTAEVNGGAPGSSFLFSLSDQSGATTSAVFAWEGFLSGPGPVTITSPLTPFAPGSLQQVNSWQLISTFVGGSPIPINVTFSNANASTGQAPARGIAGNSLSSVGSNASALGNWTYSSTNGTLSGTPNYGDSVGGAASVSNYGSATQISLTASASVASGTPFTYVLTDNTGDQAFAAFNWSSFTGGTKTVAASLVQETFFDPTNVVNWRIVSATTALAVNATIYGSAGVSSATSTTLDNFTVSIAPIVGSGSANSTVTVGGFASGNRSVDTLGGGLTEVTIGGGLLQIVGANDSAGAGFIYEDFVVYAPEQKFLRFDFTLAANLDGLLIELQSANGGAPVGGVFSVPDYVGARPFFVDLSLLSGYSSDFMAGLNRISIVYSSNQANFETALTNVSLTSVPEPSAVALIVAASLGLFFCHRRRMRHTR